MAETFPTQVFDHGLITELNLNSNRKRVHVCNVQYVANISFADPSRR